MRIIISHGAWYWIWTSVLSLIDECSNHWANQTINISYNVKSAYIMRIIILMVLGTGIEPMTSRLSGECSNHWANQALFFK